VNEDAHVSLVILLLLLVIAAGIDMQRHRIPNVLSLGGIVLGIALQGWASGLPGIIAGAGGTAVGIGIFLPFYLAHGMGAGDVKLMGTVGAFLGPKFALLASGLCLGAGGVLAIIILISRGGLKDLAIRYMSTFKCLITTGKLSHIPPKPGEVASVKFPYATAIGIGTLVTLWWMGAFQGFTEFLLTATR
jgi:prepilin peptidase CpaA